MAEEGESGPSVRTVFPAVGLVVLGGRNRSPKVIAKALRTGFHRIVRLYLPLLVGSRDRQDKYRHFRWLIFCDSPKNSLSRIAPAGFAHLRKRSKGDLHQLTSDSGRSYPICVQPALWGTATKKTGHTLRMTKPKYT